MLSTHRLNLGLILSAGASLLPSAQAYAQADASARGDELEAIVVTAQRRSENLQTVPVAITSISGKTLENTNFQSVTDLQYVVPGVEFDPSNGAAFQIRGVGSTSFDFSNEKSVSLVVDDVVMDGQRDNGLTGLNDIQQVDVLMGPQGTLFGKNATSGVISITIARPVLGQWSAKVGTSYGERNDRDSALTVNAPLGDKVALRVSGFAQGQDGYGEYTTLHQPLNSFSEYGYRAKILFEPIDGLQILYTNDYAHHWDNFIRTAVSGALPAVTALENADGVTPSLKNDNDADSQMGLTRTDVWGHSLRVQYQVGRDTLTSITAYRLNSYYGTAPADLVPADQFSFLPYNIGQLHNSKVSQEFRWASPTGGFVEYLGGFFYNRLLTQETQVQWATLGAPLVSSTGVPLTHFYDLSGAIGASGDASRYDTQNTSTAGFGQLKFNITSRASLAFSGRYTADDNYQSLSYIRVDPLPITGVKATFTPTSSQPYKPSGRVRESNFSYRVAGQYKLTDDAMVYATYSTGYKPGGVAFVGNQYSPYSPETVASIEGGIKSELFERRVRLDFDIFSEKFTDFQASVVSYLPGDPLPEVAIGNAGGLESQGAEATLGWKAGDGLTFNGAVTYADAHFTDYQYNTTTNYAGTTLTNAPRWSASASADYDHAVSSNLRLRANFDYSFRSKVWTVLGQPAYSEIPAFGLANGRIGLSPLDRNLEFGVYGRNLFNTYYSTGLLQYSTLSLVHYTDRDAHRTVGVFANYAF